jgi:DNA-binding transcriptional LysR family regulator
MELRHLRYFVAAVEWKSLRAASRKIYVAQPAISQTISNLESELGVALLKRSGGKAIELTSEGEVFYRESLKTLKQADRSVEIVQRTAKGELGSLSVGFCGASTYAFLPDLVREYKEQNPGVKVELLELTPANQEAAFRKGLIDLGFTRPLASDFASTHKSMKVSDLAQEKFVLFHRKGSPQLFDTIVTLCNENGFSPNVESEPDLLQTALTLVAADQGVSIVPSCALSLRVDGVTLLRIRPDNVRIELVLAWPKQADSPVTKTFLDLVKKRHDLIHRKATVVS